jgi:hypothetical protein
MSGASSTYAPPRTRTGGASLGQGQRPAAQVAAGRVRWDRLGRIAMLLVLLALVFLYLSAGAHMLSSWKQSTREASRVSTLEREHRALLREHNTLSSQSNLEVQAHQLDLLRPGERPYIVANLPRN